MTSTRVQRSNHRTGIKSTDYSNKLRMRKVTQKPLLIGGESATPDALSADHLGHLIRDPLFSVHTSPSSFSFLLVLRYLTCFLLTRWKQRRREICNSVSTVPCFISRELLHLACGSRHTYLQSPNTDRCKPRRITLRYKASQQHA